MRPNVKLIISFEEFEELINFRAIGTIPNIHITGASCDNDRGMVVLSAIDMRRKPLRNIELATSVPFFEFADGRLLPRETGSSHKCRNMTGGHIIKRSSTYGRWYYSHLVDSMPVVEFCPWCGFKLGTDHLCEYMPRYYAILKVGNEWKLDIGEGDGFRIAVIFCPWCGLKLEV